MKIIDTGLKFAQLTKRSKTEEIVLHHAAGNGDVQSIHKMHKNVNGWAGIGYHFYVRKDGSIYKGRPLDTVGAHAYGSNSNSIGICFEGNFETEEMSIAQKASGAELVSWVMDRYPSIVRVTRHSAHNATACPGKYFPFEDIIAVIVSDKPEEEEKTVIPNAEYTGAAGEKLTLQDEPLFYTAYDTKPVDTKSGTYYRWDAAVINGKIKITNSAANVGKYGQVTGWIKAPAAAKTTHKVVSGDTLSALAEKYKTTVDAIYKANKGKYPTMTKNYIVVGWVLDIPN